MDNRITEFPGVLDENMNTELYLLNEAEITEAQYEAIKAGYGVTGPDFQIVQRGEKYYLKGDTDIEQIKVIVNALIIDKGGEAVFTDESSEDAGNDEQTEG